jgi:leucyl aminopeptidase (aminopeptidase T)
MVKLQQAANIILKTCMGIKKGESVLIITDKNRIDIAHVLFKQAQKLTKVKLLNIPIGSRSGEEPPEYVENEMLKHNVILILTTKSLTHTKATRNAAKKGARIASMPGITKEMLERAIDVDYKEMEKQTEKMKQLLNKGTKVKITTKKGTNIKFSIKGRKAKGSAGILSKKRALGNLPAGESFLAPVENTANGKIIIDGSILNLKIKNKITIKVKNGYAENIKGKFEAKLLNEILEKVKNKKAYNIAELGIGTNPKAIVTGNTLEDEKVKGTCHLALGNNIGFGGKTDVPVHIDGVIKKPTIFIDGKVIIKDGKLL